MTNRIVTCALVGVLVLAPIMHAYAASLPVVDIGAITQLALALKEQIRMVQNQAKDLASLASLASMLDTVNTLRGLADEVSEVYSEMDAIRKGWMMLSDPSALPQTAEDLYSWIQQAEMFSLQSTRTGMEAVDKIISSVISLLQRMLALLNGLGGVSGSVGGLQYVSSLLQIGLGQAEQLKAAVLAGQHTLIGPPLIESVRALAYPAIIGHEMRNWGQP
jgi:conjugal transfer/entry exclusion protein